MASADGLESPRDSVSIEYSVRVSSRARRVRLVMKPSGLEVVIPRGFNARRIPELVEGKRAWIEKVSGDMERARGRLAQGQCLPDRVALPALEEEWSVDYLGPASAASSASVRVREASGQRLLVTGDAREYEACRQALLRWLGRRARESLVPRLESLAERHGFSYRQVSIRRQRTRWGSCSRRGTISLNAKLLLLPQEAVEYVLLHELCHTVHLDHSAAFWRLLAELDPEYKIHRKVIRAASRQMPGWLESVPDGGYI